MKSSKSQTESKKIETLQQFNQAETIEFESALLELNRIVDALSANKMNLSESLSEYERAVSLIRTCQMQLDDAKQKISILRKQQDGLVELEPFRQTTD